MISRNSHGLEVQIYGDDTVYKHMQRITEWLDQSCLSLNTNKTKGTFFTKTKLHTNTDIFIKSEKIQIVTEFKYLSPDNYLAVLAVLCSAVH